MTLLGRILERRTITPQDFRTGADVDDWFRTSSGERVDLDAVLAIQHVWSCVTLIVNDIRKLPVDAYRDLGEDRKEHLPAPRWMTFPDLRDPNVKFSDHVAQAVLSILVDGNAFIAAFPSVFNVEQLLLLDPTRVDIRMGRFVVKGYEDSLSALNVRHIANLVKPGATRGVNPIQATREGFGLTMAAERFGQTFFDRGAVMSGVIETPVGAVVDADRLKKDFSRNHDIKRNAHAIGVLTNGATFKTMSFSPEDTQFIALRKYQLEDAARLFHVPPFKIGSTDPGAVAYASTTNARIDYVESAIVPIVTLLEDAYSDLLPGDDTYVKFNLNALLRGDPKARHEAYSVGLQNRFLKVDEVRALEDMQPFGESGGGGFLDTPNSVVVDPRVTEAVALIGAGADPAETLAALGLPPITFAPPPEPAPIVVAPPDEAEPPERVAPVTVNITQPDMTVSDVRIDPEIAMVINKRIDAQGQAVVDEVAAQGVDVAQQVGAIADDVSAIRGDVQVAAAAIRDEVARQMAEAREQQRAETERILAIPSVVRSVTLRDTRGRPLVVEEQRGDVLIRKIVERDDDGRIVKVTEVAA